jgi:hypothetical protein
LYLTTIVVNFQEAVFPQVFSGSSIPSLFFFCCCQVDIR